jgi:hypothetical protein
MIRGRLLGAPGRLRPFVTAHLVLRAPQIVGDVDFLVDTGADSTVLAPTDTLRLGIDITQLPQGPRSTGVGGMTATVSITAAITPEQQTLSIPLRILAPVNRRQQAALSRIPSLLGRDVLSHFALFFEARTSKVLLLEPHEADALGLA